MQDVKDEYRKKVNLCRDHVEKQSDYLREILEKMEKEIVPAADCARAVETVGIELERRGKELTTLSRQYVNYLKAVDKESKARDTIETTGGA